MTTVVVVLDPVEVPDVDEPYRLVAVVNDVVLCDDEAQAQRYIDSIQKSDGEKSYQFMVTSAKDARGGRSESAEEATDDVCSECGAALDGGEHTEPSDFDGRHVIDDANELED